MTEQQRKAAREAISVGIRRLRVEADIDPLRAANALGLSVREYLSLEDGQRDLLLSQSLILADLYGVDLQKIAAMTGLSVDEWSGGEAAASERTPEASLPLSPTPQECPARTRKRSKRCSGG